MIWNGSGGMGRRLWTLRNCSLERDAREEGGRGRAQTVLPWFLVSAVGRTGTRLKIHSRRLPEGIHQRYPLRTKHAPLRGIFGPNSVSVARYASSIGTKSPTKWDAQPTESNFQTRSKGPGCKNRRFAVNYGAGLMPAPPWAAGFGRGALQIRLLFLHPAP